MHASFPAFKIAQGKFLTDFGLDARSAVSKCKFYVPILSGICGMLIPQSEYRLIPCVSLN